MIDSDRDRCNGGWAFPAERINWTGYAFYGADIRESAVDWFLDQLRRLAAERQTEREMVTGETHYLWGRSYRLRTFERPGRAHFEVDGDHLRSPVHPAATRRFGRATPVDHSLPDSKIGE